MHVYPNLFYTQKRVANPSATGNVPKVQKFIQGNTTPTSRVSSNKENVARAGTISNVLLGLWFRLLFFLLIIYTLFFTIKGENSNGPRCIPSVHEKEPLFPPKSSTGAESSAAVSEKCKIKNSIITVTYIRSYFIYVH